MTALAPALQAFFTDRLISQRQASRHTIALLPRHLRLLLLLRRRPDGQAALRAGLRRPRAPLITALPRPPGARAGQHRPDPQRPAGRDPLAVRLRRAAPPRPRRRHPPRPGHPAAKRFRTSHHHLPDRSGSHALLAGTRPGTWTRPPRPRPAAGSPSLTGLRAAELTGLTRADAHLGDGAHPACHGKGRKDRVTPLLRDTVAVLRRMARRKPRRAGAAPCSPPGAARPMSHDAIEDCVERHTATAATTCPSLTSKNVTPHVLRHSCAVRMLRSGIDIAVIALWMGHESTRTDDDLPELSGIASDGREAAGRHDQGGTPRGFRGFSARLPELRVAE